MVGAEGEVSPNWSQETMIFHSSNCFSNKYCLVSGKRTIADFSSEQLSCFMTIDSTADIPHNNIS